MPPPESASELPLADERWELVRRVAESQLFRKSPRLHDFLLYICENTLRNRLECVREQQIGTQVFGRRPDYNMSDDSIVRVEARELRKRLAVYFESDGKDEPVIIKIPKGSYVPVFEPRAAAEAGNGSRAEPAGDEPVAAPAAPPRPEVWRRPAVWATVLLCIALAAWIAVRRFPTAAARGAVPTVSVEDHAFYFDLLGPIANDAAVPTLIVLSNPRVVLYFGSPEVNASGHESGRVVPAPPEIHRLLKDAMNIGDETLPYRYFSITSDAYTGMGEAVSAFHLGRLMRALNRPARLTQGRFLNWESAQKEHLIVLGSPHINAWTQENVLKGDFRLVSGAIQNAQPLPGEAAEYRTVSDPKTGAPLLDYGVISMQASPAGSRILVLAGRTSPGTYGVGEFFSSPERMRPIYERLREASAGRPFPANWQVLLKMDIRDGIPIATSYVAHRVYDTSSR